MTGDLAHRATAPGGTVRRDSGPEGTDTAGWCPASAPRACVVAVADDEIADTIPAVMMQLAVSALAVRAPFAMRSAATTRTSVLQMSTYATFKTTKGDFKVRRAGFWVPQRGPHAMSGECNPNGTLPALCPRSLTSPLLPPRRSFSWTSCQSPPPTLLIWPKAAFTTASASTALSTCRQPRPSPHDRPQRH